jgi:hypothetical protein
MKTSSMTRIKGALALGPMVLALSAFGSHGSYAFDPYDDACSSPFYAQTHRDYPPYGYPDCGYADGGFWRTHHHDHDDHGRPFHDSRFDHSRFGGVAHGGYGHGAGMHGDHRPR